MKIFSVTQVTVTKVSETPLVLHVAAEGLATTTGWKNPRLDNSIDPNPADQVFEFSFEADRPDGIVLQVLTPIHATTEVRPPKGIEAVLVVARTNSISVHVSDFTGGERAPFTTMAVGEETPFPTTLRVGEEDPTTHVRGEEDPTTLRFGEENPTTWMLGEEDPTTRFRGEEGVPSTLRFGEENPTTEMLGEEGPSTRAFGEEGPITDPRVDDPMSGGGGFGGPFGGF